MLDGHPVDILPCLTQLILGGWVLRGACPSAEKGAGVSALVVFAPPGTTPLLGATALETTGLAVDPIPRRLIPVPALLK